MARISYYEIVNYIQKENQIGDGKEVKVYSYQDKVIKIFHSVRKTSLPRISDEGLLKLSELSLHCFNTPIDIIDNEDHIVGYTEKFLEEKEVNFALIDFDSIKEDLITLSTAGFCIEDLFYNYIFTDTNLWFIDLLSYRYLKTDSPFLKKQNLKKNIAVMNQFLIGLLLFNAFLKGKGNEYTKMYLANEYRREHCEDLFFGDYIKEENKNIGKKR